MRIGGKHLFATQTHARGSITHAWPFQKRPAFAIHRGVKSKDKSSDRCWSIRWQKKIRKDFYDSLGTIDIRRISTFNPARFGSFRTALRSTFSHGEQTVSRPNVHGVCEANESEFSEKKQVPYVRRSGFMSPAVIANHHRHVFPDGLAQAPRGNANEFGLVLPAYVVESTRKILRASEYGAVLAETAGGDIHRLPEMVDEISFGYRSRSLTSREEKAWCSRYPGRPDRRRAGCKVCRRYASPPGVRCLQKILPRKW